MFELKYVKRKNLVAVVEYMNELGDKIDQFIHEEAYLDALRLALELREIGHQYFSAQHVFRGFIAARIGFLYYTLGLWQESFAELKKAQKIFFTYQSDFPLDLFEVNHLLFRLAVNLHDGDTIIETGQLLLSDSAVTTKLQIRIYISMAREYLFAKKDYELTRKYIFKAKRNLETLNLIYGDDYADVLYLSAHYYSRLKNRELALKFIEEAYRLASTDLISPRKAVGIIRSLENLKDELEAKEGLRFAQENLELMILSDSQYIN